MACASACAVASGAAPLTPDELKARFPRPGAAIVARLAGAFGADGKDAEAVAFRLTDGGYRLALFTPISGGGWELAAGNIKTLDVTGDTRLEARDMTGDGRPEIVVRGAHGLGGFYGLYDQRDGHLVTLLTLVHEAERPPLETDVDGDGVTDVVERGGEGRLWPGGPRLAEETVRGWRFDGRQFEPHGWLPTGKAEADRHLARLMRLAAAQLWSAAADEAAEMRRLADGPEARWDAGLVRVASDLTAAQAQRLAAHGGPEDTFAAGLAWVMAGDYGRAAAALLSAAGPDALPAGWETPTLHLARLVELAGPEQGGVAGLAAVRALVALAADREPAARTALAQAYALDPRLPHAAAWLEVGRPMARLWQLDADGNLGALDLSRSGRLTTEPHSWPEWDRARSVAAPLAAHGVAWVTADGEEIWFSPDTRQRRRLLASQYLWLGAGAFSPDGRWLAVDEGTGAVRRLRLLETATGRESGAITYAGGYVWSPDSRRLAVELPRLVTPPLPWADGGTRDIALLGLDGHLSAPLAQGDAQSLWLLDDWLPSGMLLASRRTLRTVPDGQVTVRDSERFRLDAEHGLLPAVDKATRAEEDVAAARRALPVPGLEVRGVAPGQSRLVVWRTARDGESSLYAAVRGASQAHRLGSAPPLERAFLASWGLPEEER